MCEVQHVALWIAYASDSRLSGADGSPGFGNLICSEPWHLPLTVAFSTQANKWVVHGKLLAESNLTEMPQMGFPGIGRHPIPGNYSVVMLIFVLGQKQQGADFVSYIWYKQCKLTAILCSFSRPKRILGLCYVVVKVSILMNFNILLQTNSYTKLC